MNLPVVLRPEARTDLIEARAWYNWQRTGLGDEFREVVDEMFTRISQMPDLYAVVLKEVRRCKLRKFPYVVYYRVLSDRVEVLAVLDGRRDPGVWQSRIKDS